MKEEKPFCQVLSGNKVDDGEATRERYEALLVDQSDFFRLDEISATAWRAVEEGRLTRRRPVPPAQLVLLLKLIESGQGMTAAELGVTDSTVEEARRMIEKPPERRGAWRLIQTIRGDGRKWYRFGPEKGLPWHVFRRPPSQERPDSVEPSPATIGVTLSAAPAEYFHGDGIIIVPRTEVMNGDTPATVMRMELVVPVRDGTKVLSPSEPSGRFELGDEWLWPTHFRLGASDGASGALEFPAWSYDLDPDDVVPGSVVLAATLGNGMRVETKIDLRLLAA